MRALTELQPHVQMHLKLATLLAFGSVFAGLASAHITIFPNFGYPSGGYSRLQLRIPHGTTSLETTKIKVAVPHGILSVAPVALAGWETNIVTRQIPPYLSHGVAVTTGPAEISWTAICSGPDAPTLCTNDDHAGLHNSHLLELEMSVRFGCDFGVDADGLPTDDATEWMDEYTLWWKTEQYVSTPGTNDGNLDGNPNMLPWTGVVAGSASWHSAIPKPSPFVFIYSDDSCVPPDSTGDPDGEVGMRWDGSVIPPALNQEAVKTRAEVVGLITEQQLSQAEEWDTKLSSASKATSDAESQAEIATIIAIVGVVLSGAMVLAFLMLTSFRVTNPTGFRKVLLSDEGGGTTMQMGPNVVKKGDLSCPVNPNGECVCDDI
ncbi:hypothetical protein TrST_g2686 [Triparma strigata]|uniref:YncI copper-binding domain-containing protein n=1 Tax=Triparma strigata TaxID=1606541 RepID=A0A9W7BPW4_9STRA|nr:hypothetical protein TrST_g2686 [Triparma strigata]